MVENWDRENVNMTPEVTVYPYQPEIRNHACHPNGYDHLGLVLMKTMQVRIDINPEKNPHDIYDEVYQEILDKFGPIGDDLTDDEQSIRDLIKASLTPWAALKSNIYRYKGQHLPKAITKQSDFDANHPFNFIGNENICKYAGKCDEYDDNSWILIFATNFTLSLIHAATGLFVDGKHLIIKSSSQLRITIFLHLNFQVHSKCPLCSGHSCSLSM